MPLIVAGVGNHENVADYIHATYPGQEYIQPIMYNEQLGNGGDLVRAVRDRGELFKDSVLVVCVDVLLDINEAELLAFHLEKGGEVSIALTRNCGVPNENAYFVGRDDEVVYCCEVNQSYINENNAAERCAYKGSSTGALVVSKSMLTNLAWQPEDGPLSLYSQVVAIAIGRSSMFAFDNGERLFTDIGTVDSWDEAQTNHDTIAPYIHYSD